MAGSPKVAHYSRKLGLTQPLLTKAHTPERDEVGGVTTTTFLTLASPSAGKPLFATVIFAQTTGGGAAQLTQGFGLALGVMFLFGFIWGVLKIWSGANAISKGDPDGKAGIIAGIIIAGAAAIMGALFAIFGLSGGTLTPSF